MWANPIVALVRWISAATAASSWLLGAMTGVTVPILTGLVCRRAGRCSARLEVRQYEDGVRRGGLGVSVPEWSEAVLDPVGPDPLVVVGASVGGFCALDLARRAPEQVRAILLVGSKAGVR
jgi:pimeloyl-ACP methyl ester carboxylesterase